MAPDNSETGSVRRTLSSSEKDQVESADALRDPEKDRAQLSSPEVTDQLDTITYVSGFQYWAIVFVSVLSIPATVQRLFVASAALPPV